MDYLNVRDDIETNSGVKISVSRSSFGPERYVAKMNFAVNFPKRRGVTRKPSLLEVRYLFEEFVGVACFSSLN